MKLGLVSITVAMMLLLFGGCGGAPNEIEPPQELTAAEQAATIESLRPPKRTRPVIAVLGDNAGTETTDFLIPYGVLKESKVADVVAVAPTAGAIQLMPALAIQPQQTTASFDATYPRGADYVIVPAMHQSDSPAVLDWIRAQSKSGAIIVGICSGALVLAEAGLLDGRRATTHWFDLDALERRVPNLTRVDDRRYVVDRGVVTTTGVSASLPVSLALVEAISGVPTARALARELGSSEDWTPRHESDAFKLSAAAVGRALSNWLAFWRHERIGIRISADVDEIALAFAADAYSRTYRSKAYSVAATMKPIESKRGLLLLPDHAESLAKIDHYAELGGGAQALDRALDGIRERYGDGAASLVALQLEYRD